MRKVAKLVLAFSCCFTSLSALSEDRSFIIDKIDNLEHRLLTIENNFAIAQQDNAKTLDLLQRITNLEDRLNLLYGKVEALEHKVDISLANTSTSPTPVQASTILVPEGAAIVVSKDDTASIGDNVFTGEIAEYSQMIKEGNFQKAIIGLQKFIDKNSKSDEAGVAYYFIGQAYLMQEKGKQAGMNFLKSYKNYPDNEMAAESLLGLVKYVASTGQQQKACKLLQKLDIEYPTRSTINKEVSAQEKEKLGC